MSSRPNEKEERNISKLMIIIIVFLDSDPCIGKEVSLNALKN